MPVAPRRLIDPAERAQPWLALFDVWLRILCDRVAPIGILSELGDHAEQELNGAFGPSTVSISN